MALPALFCFSLNTQQLQYWHRLDVRLFFIGSVGTAAKQTSQFGSRPSFYTGTCQGAKVGVATQPFHSQTKGDVMRNGQQQLFLVQHRVGMLEQCCNHSKQCRCNVATLHCPKNRCCELSCVTSPQVLILWCYHSNESFFAKQLHSTKEMSGPDDLFASMEPSHRGYYSQQWQHTTLALCKSECKCPNLWTVLGILTDTADTDACFFLGVLQNGICHFTPPSLHLLFLSCIIIIIIIIVIMR